MLILPPLVDAPVADKERRGVILLVVISLLALFASIGIGFVYYAEAEATAARFSVQAGTQLNADIDPEILTAFALSQIIYGTTDPASALRGYDLARGIYGWNAGAPNIIPFNGPGRGKYNDPRTNRPNFVDLNYTTYVPPQLPLSQQAIRDPEYIGYRDDPTTFRYTNGANVPWTYPDLESFYLAPIN
jgi:hypothetical protein